VQRGIEAPAADEASRLRSVRAYRDAIFGQHFRDRPPFALDWPGRSAVQLGERVRVEPEPHRFRRHRVSLTLQLQLQGGHTYALGVAFEAEIAYDCRDRTGHPHKKKPGDDIRLRASIAGTVAGITAST
jgi:hypothetical protein